VGEHQSFVLRHRIFKSFPGGWFLGLPIRLRQPPVQRDQFLDDNGFVIFLFCCFHCVVGDLPLDLTAAFFSRRMRLLMALDAEMT
jgi:hypothetical protein